MQYSHIFKIYIFLDFGKFPSELKTHPWNQCFHTGWTVPLRMTTVAALVLIKATSTMEELQTAHTALLSSTKPLLSYWCSLVCLGKTHYSWDYGLSNASHQQYSREQECILWRAHGRDGSHFRLGGSCACTTLYKCNHHSVTSVTIWWRVSCFYKANLKSS